MLSLSHRDPSQQDSVCEFDDSRANIKFFQPTNPQDLFEVNKHNQVIFSMGLGGRAHKSLNSLEARYAGLSDMS